MLDHEKTILANLEIVTGQHKGSRDEHSYLANALKYLSERLTKLHEIESAPKAEDANEDPKKD